jgi:glyoxylase-like metal-dependent hydrolase (beta-lactamase superfamily II)
MAIYFEDENIRIRKIPCGEYGNNAYVISCVLTGDSAIIDTPGEPEKVLQETRDSDVKAIFITHGHFDHILGFEPIQDSTKALVGINNADAEHLNHHPELSMDDDTEFKLGKLVLQFIHTPGHTPGSTCIIVGNHLFTGDTLFPGGPGRTRSPENLRQEIKNIANKLLCLPDVVEVYPGHGDNTTLLKCKAEYAVFASKEHPEELCGDVLWLSG